MSAESLAAFHAFMAEQERKRQRPSLLARTRRREPSPDTMRTERAVVPPQDRSALRRAVVVAGALTVGVGLGTGGAVAFWSGTATGTGSASTATMAAVTVSAGTPSSDTPLYPNGPSADLVVKVANPNPFDVSLRLSATPNTQATGCPQPDITFSGGTITVQAGATAAEKVVPASVSMGVKSSSECQGQLITVPVSATITSTTATN